MFIACDFVQRHDLETSPLAQPVPVHNVDGTLNENGSITEEVEVLLRFGPCKHVRGSTPDTTVHRFAGG
jgi:hypothetical protein